jgi:excisionase family DNA binding protein
MTELVSVKEAAEAMRLSPHTLRAWIIQRRVPFVRLGRRVLLRREDMEALIDKNLVEAQDKG